MNSEVFDQTMQGCECQTPKSMQSDLSFVLVICGKPFCLICLILPFFSIYEKLIEFCGIDEKGTNYPPVSWNLIPLYQTKRKDLNVCLSSSIINFEVQSNLFISNSLISNYRLSRSENLVPVLTWNYDNRWQNNVEKRRNCSSGAISPLFHIILYVYF